MVGQDMPLGIHHLFAVAVIGGDNDSIAVLFGFFEDLAQLRIDGMHRFFGRFEISGMAHHITIGEVDDNKIIALIHRFAYCFTHFRRAHLRLQIVGLDTGAGDQHSALAWIGLFDTAVKEEGHMGILLRLRRVQLRQPCPADHFGQCIFGSLFGEEYRIGEAGIILCHRRDMQRNKSPLELGKVLVTQCRRDLPHSITSEVHHDHGIATLHPVIPFKSNRFDKLVCLLFGITCIDVGFRSKRRFGLRFSDRAITTLYPLPTVVSVHRVESPPDRRDRDIVVTDRFDLLEVGFARSGAHVTPVRDQMQKDPLTPSFGQLGETDNMLDMRMYAAVTHQTDQVDPLTLLECLFERLILFNASILQRQRDFDQILVEDSAASDRHMPHFRVAHLSFGQADTQSGSMDQCPGCLCKQFVIRRLVGISERIFKAVWLVSNTVRNHQ